MNRDKIHSLNNAFNEGKRKGKYKGLTQKKRVFNAFYNGIKTMRQVEEETGVRVSNTCFYVSEWKETDTIKVVRFGVCPISKEGGVQFLTTNKDLFNLIKK